MDFIVEHALQIFLFILLVGFVGFMQFTRAGTELQFTVLFATVVFAIPTAVGAGLTLAAVGFLYPQAVVVDGFTGLLWFVILASLASTFVFDLGFEGLLLKVLQRFGMGTNSIKFVEAVVGSVFIAAALYVVALFLPGVGVSAGAALVAGAISAFVRYFIGLYLEDNVSDEDYVFDEEDPRL